MHDFLQFTVMLGGDFHEIPTLNEADSSIDVEADIFIQWFDPRLKAPTECQEHSIGIVDINLEVIKTTVWVPMIEVTTNKNKII